MLRILKWSSFKESEGTGGMMTASSNDGAKSSCSLNIRTADER